MKNEIKRDALRVLATAPTIAARAYLNKLPDSDRAEAAKLFQALGVNVAGYKRGDRVAVRAWTLDSVGGRWEICAGVILSETLTGYRVKSADFPDGREYDTADIFRTKEATRRSCEE